MIFCNLKILSIKKIVQVIQEIVGLDLKNYIYVSLKIKMELFCDKFKIDSFDILINKITNDKSFLNNFLRFIYNGSFELFRDPSLWRFVKKEILEKHKSKLHYRVFFPSSYQGADLFSFLILRQELNLVQEIEVIYATPLEILDQAQNGYVFEKRIHELNLSNYKRVETNGLIDQYFIKELNILKPIPDLFKNTQYHNFNETEQVFNKKADVIFYRNRLLDFNKNLQQIVIENLFNSLKPGGLFILGVKERLKKTGLVVFEEKESIYKKEI